MLKISQNTLHLLKKGEIEEIYRIPQIDEKDRNFIFSLNDAERKILSQLHTLSSKIAFILQLGFFRIKKIFYPIDELDKLEDLKEYVIDRYFSDYPSEKFPCFPQIKPGFTVPSLNVTKPTRLSQQNQILDLFNYKKCSGGVMTLVKREVDRLSQIHARPSYIVRELLRFLERGRIVVPSYSTLQNMIGGAIQKESVRLENRLDSLLTRDQKSRLDELLKMRKDFLHELTLLKRDPKNFSLKEIKSTISKRNQLNDIQPYSERFSKELGISEQNLLYYASLVEHYSIYKISRLPSLSTQLFLACFIHVRHRTINDHLIKAFLYRTKGYITEGKEAAKEQVYSRKVGYLKKLKKVGKLVALFIDGKLSDDLPFKKVREKAFSMVNKEEVAILASSLMEESIDEKELEWEEFDKMASKIKMNLRPLVLSMDIKSQPSSHSLKKEIEALQDDLRNGRPFAPSAVNHSVCSQTARKYITPGGEILSFRYEWQLYRRLAGGLISGDLFVSDSLSYKSFDEDLVETKAWENKESLIGSLGLPKLKSHPKDLLDGLEKEFNELSSRANERILSGENSYIKFSGKNNEKWTLPYTKPEEPNKIAFFKSLPPIGLNTLLNLVDTQCSFTSAFTHVLGRYVKSDQSMKSLLAAITACATNIGLKKMARNANVSSEDIHQAYRNFIRPETLKAACDAVVDGIKNLPLFSNWNIDGEEIYSSSDGQKFGVSRDTCNARYSSKYFGLEKGVVSYTLNANYVPINSRIIGANEHESQFVLDILLDNTSEIRSNTHTTDSHGENKINFPLLFFFDYVFAPRYKNFSKEAKNIYCFKTTKKHSNHILQPKGVINRELVEKEWDNIVRIMVSLGMKTTSQSIIVRKLNAYSRKNRTLRALEELNKILKSMHILRYMDELKFRQHIQKALNRGESYHNLKKAIFYDNLGKFRVSSEYEQNIWSECTRLLALTIIYYNSFILSQVAARRSNLGLEIDSLKEVCPIQWEHVDLFGHFYFGDEPNKNEIENILTAIENMDISLE